MVELAVGPLHRVMACGTGRRELRAHVINRSLGIVVVGLVTRDAIRIGDVVVVIDVAVGTLPWRHRMRSGQRES